MGEVKLVTISVPICTGYNAQVFESNLVDKRISCQGCEDHPDCDRIFYRFSHTKQKLNPNSWCSKLKPGRVQDFVSLALN